MSWGAIAAGAAGLGADYFSNQAQNIQNAAEAKKQRRWLEKMSNSAHQREVRDLRAAHLNPILSAGGGGASVPNAAVPHMEKAELGDKMASVINDSANAVSTAKQAQTAKEVGDTSILLNNANAAKSQADAQRAMQETIKLRNENNRYKKYGPADDKLGEMAQQGLSTFDRMMNNLGNKAKELGRVMSHNPAQKKGIKSFSKDDPYANDPLLKPVMNRKNARH